MDSTLRIAFDAKRAYHNHRGLGNYSRDVIRLLTTYAPENEYLLYARPTDRYTFAHTQTISPRGVWSLMPSLWRSFGCVHDMDGVDIYWGLSGELPFGIHRKPIKKVITIHDAIFLRYPDLYSAGYRQLFTRKVQYACDHADMIIAISEQTKRDIMDFFHADERKIRVVYQGCNKRFREPVSENSMQIVKQHYALPDKYLLIVGAIEPRKNIQNLIEAISLAGIELPLVAVGAQNKYALQTAELAKKRKVELIYLHDLPFADLPAVYKGTEVFCYPSIFEGFGIPILEAMCVGTPVLTSTGSCFAETGGNAALYADPMHPEEIAQQITRILSSPEIRRTMIEKGHEQANLFTDEIVANNLISVYKSLNAQQ